MLEAESGYPDHGALRSYMMLVVSNSVSQSAELVSQSVSQSVRVSSGLLYALAVALHLLLCKNQHNCSSYVIANYSGALLR